MSGGIRDCCGKCYSKLYYDIKLQYCKACGWKANQEQTNLMGLK